MQWHRACERERHVTNHDTVGSMRRHWHCNSEYMSNPYISQVDHQVHEHHMSHIMYTRSLFRVCSWLVLPWLSTPSPQHLQAVHSVTAMAQDRCKRNQVYQYKVLPFGLKDCLWVFTRLVAVVIASLRRQGIRIFHYLDDWLLVANSRALLEIHLEIILHLTKNLAFWWIGTCNE